MPPLVNHLSYSASRRYFALFLVSAALEGLGCLVWLLNIPTDCKNAVLWGYSAQRLGMGALLLVPALLLLASAMSRKAKEAGIDAASRFLGVNRVSYISSGILFAAGLLGLGLLAVSPSRFGDLQYVFARVKPLIAWPVMVCWQTVLVLIWVLLRQNHTIVRAIAADFSESLAFLPARKLFISMSLIGMLAGAFFAITLREVGRQVLASIPGMTLLGLLFGVLLFAYGMLYNRSLVRFVPIGTLLLLVAALAANALTTPTRVGKSNAIIQPARDGSAIVLGQQYHYSLSVYHILSILYPNSEFEATPELLEKWDLDKDALNTWVSTAQVINITGTTHLNDSIVEAILRYLPVEVEINKIEGIQHYYFIPSSASGQIRVAFVEYEDKRFVLPKELLAQILKEQGAAP